MTLTQQHRVALTVIAILLGIAIIVAGFVHRIQQPRIMTVSEMRANGLFVFDTPRDPGKFVLLTTEAMNLLIKASRAIGRYCFSVSRTALMSVRQHCLF